MKKIIDASLGGMNFSMEEDAYQMLKDYLRRFEATIPNQNDAREVMEDVEARVAEIFHKEAKFPNQVVDITFVKIVIEHLGEIEDNNKYDSPNNEYDKYESTTNKRLYRNPEDKKVAGICSGIAIYFNMDPTIIRLIFILLVFAYGASIIVYPILWFVLPVAITTDDKLRMRGIPSTLENIKKYSSAQNNKTR